MSNTLDGDELISIFGNIALICIPTHVAGRVFTLARRQSESQWEPITDRRRHDHQERLRRSRRPCGAAVLSQSRIVAFPRIGVTQINGMVHIHVGCEPLIFVRFTDLKILDRC